MATPRHQVFVSYHHEFDQGYRDAFERLFANTYDILVDKSVQIGDIGQNLKVATIRQKIRDEYLRDSTVTVVLVKPKHLFCARISQRWCGIPKSRLASSDHQSLSRI